METPKNHDSAQSESGLRKRQKKLLQAKIRKQLMKLNLSLLLNELIVGIFEITPADVKTKAAELKLPLKKTHVADLLCHRTKAFNIEELNGIGWSLELYRAAFYSHLKRWQPVNLLEPYEDFQPIKDEGLITRNLRQALRTKGLDAVIKVITHEEMIWIIIVEKKLTRNRGMKMKPPIFLCYEVGTPYIFLSSKVSNAIIESIVKAMHYNNHKMQQLEGKDVKSLLSILKHKSINRYAPEVVYQPADYDIDFRNVDFTKVKARKAYANKVFETREPVKLETFTVTAGIKWSQDSVPDLVDEPFPTRLVLKSKNVIDMIKNMGTTGMMTTPMPGYSQAMLRAAKNTITIVQPTD